MNPTRLTFIFLFVATTLTAWSQESREVSKTVPLDEQGTLSIDTYKGSITITTWEKASVGVHVRIELDGQYDNSAGAVEDVDIHIEGSGMSVEIRTDYDRVRRSHKRFWGMFGDESVSLPLVHYTITMPATARLRVKDYKSESSVTGLTSPVRFNTYKGEVKFHKHAGAVDLETYKGEVTVEFTKLLDDCRFETYKGEIALMVPRGAGFRVETDFDSRADFDSDIDLVVQTSGRKSRERNYRGSVNGGGPRLELKTYKGSYRLHSY